MDEFIAQHGHLALFLLSFLAATLIPLGSEWLLATLLLNGGDALLAVSLATAGNTLGALTTYAVGLWGGTFLIERVLRIDASSRQRAERLYARFGSWSLLLSWLPVIGDPLCLAGGILRVAPLRFVLLAGSGKLARYAVLAMLVKNAGSFPG
ncbi:membrane protein [Desulfuromonas versatilis]|uniref:Membrane protein n=1 Tax=Desulfuromonas versatilis TaxID=2802975 RepID=A0ABM8HNL4_9BACT|nr:YqaA family protein [Desulfuromonas versatilis]BCR03096.1 membrane protein [Desulfuromonas versatilis]